jgi:HemY protein
MERAATAPTEGDWSDLDPSGDAFIYADPDWHRLVLAYGDRSELVHPRLDANAPTRLALSVAPEVSEDAVPVEEVVTEEPKPLEDPAPVITDTTTDAPVSDIAKRLDSLLDDPKPE